MTHSERKIPILIKKIKAMEFKAVNDIKHIKSMSDEIYEEWTNLKIQLRKKVGKNISIGKMVARYQSEEELVVGLVWVLNEKILDFLAQSTLPK